MILTYYLCSSSLIVISIVDSYISAVLKNAASTETVQSPQQPPFGKRTALAARRQLQLLRAVYWIGGTIRIEIPRYSIEADMVYYRVNRPLEFPLRKVRDAYSASAVHDLVQPLPQFQQQS